MIRCSGVIITMLGLAGPALAQDAGERAGPFKVHPEAGRQPAYTLGSGRTLWLFSSGDVFPVYIADPHKPTSSVEFHRYTRVGAADSTEVRTSLAGGGRFGLFRLDPARPEGRSWQLSLEAGIDAVFDSNRKMDNLGWDGNYGFTLTTKTGGPFAFKLAYLHISAHVGDEYAERTGRARIDYTREEVVLGVSWHPAPEWRVYAEGARAHYLLTEEQKPWRAQGGMEYVTRPFLLGGRFSWYAAADFSSYEERGWRVDTAVQTGILTSSSGRRFRLGVAYFDGRVPIGEFFEDTEARFTLGVWMDL